MGNSNSQEDARERELTTLLDLNRNNLGDGSPVRICDVDRETIWEVVNADRGASEGETFYRPPEVPLEGAHV